MLTNDVSHVAFSFRLIFAPITAIGTIWQHLLTDNFSYVVLSCRLFLF
jgi:hypothetical protein